MRIKPGVWLLLGGSMIAWGAYAGNNVQAYYASAGGGLMSASLFDKLSVFGPILAGILTIVKPSWPYIKPFIVDEANKILPISLKEVIAAVLRLRGVLINEHPEIYAKLKEPLDIIFGYLGYVPPEPPKPTPETGISDEQVLKFMLQIKAVESKLGGQA